MYLLVKYSVGSVELKGVECIFWLSILLGLLGLLDALGLLNRKALNVFVC